MALVIEFKDFRRHAIDNNRRVYYYQSDNFLELYFISEGIMIHSFVDLSVIPNKELFFGDDLFVGATKLLFRLPIGTGTDLSIRDIVPKPRIVDEYMPVEKDGGTDLQKEGVGDE